jgi:hypothetical protein
MRGFQRLFWWPKWTPALIISSIVTFAKVVLPRFGPQRIVELLRQGSPEPRDFSAPKPFDAGSDKCPRFLRADKSAEL